VFKTNFINKSYKDRLRATYTLLMFLVLILLSAFLYYQMNKTVKPIIGDIGVHVIESEAQYFGQRFYNQREILELLSSTEAFKTGDLIGIKKEIDNQMHRYGDLLISMKFKAINGKEYNNNPKNIIISNNYENELLNGYKSALITQTEYNDNLSEYISFTGTKVTDNNGKILGTLVINAEVKKSILSVKKNEISELGEMWIFDSNGNLIIDPNKKELRIYDVEGFKKQIKNNTAGEVKITSPKGPVSYLIYSKIPNTEGLYLAMGIDHKDFSEAMNFSMISGLSGVALACIFIFIFANKITNVVTRPLTRMVEIIQNTDGTNLIEIPCVLKDSRDEIGILANTIDAMSRNIRSNVYNLNAEIKERQRAEENLMVLNNELEFRVEERTSLLTKVTKSLSISEDRFRIALEAAHIGLYDSDCINNRLVVNGVFLKLINSPEYNQGHIKECDWLDFNEQLTDYVYEEDILKVKRMMEDNTIGILEDFYEEFRLKENPNTWLSLSGQVVNKDEHGKTMRFIGVLQNISERKNNEVQLKSSKEEAEEASQAKSQFLANMSHEIRTPMNAIMGLTHLIGQSDLNISQKNYVSKIEGSSNTLLRIINDILDFSKIEAGKIEIEHIKFNLDKVLENVSNLYAVSATNKGIDINFDTGEGVPEVLMGDSLRLEQIISNLTTNAIKFTSDGEVNVSVSVIYDNENKVKLLFSVTDTGIGLTKEQIERLFTAFTQADGSMTRKYGGTGLGLAISKQLVELMNGEIWVESKYGTGASFKFTMEFDKVMDEPKLSYLEYPDLQGKKVLVVDHNKTSLKILERMLKSFSLEVTALGNPFKAIELCQMENFDLLIVDFNLPELSGIDLYKRLIANTGVKVPKTIFVSATGRESYYNQVNQLGVKNFLVKPINRSLMFDAVMNALKGTGTNRNTKGDYGEGQIKYKLMLEHRNILLVEDNEINQLVAKDILEGVGIHVSIASNGEEAIKQIRANKFDVVLMDVQMPIMDGYKATEIIRKSYSESELPIIAMTANVLKGDREISIKSGMNDYISKPINPEILFETLVKWSVNKNVEKIENSSKESFDKEVPNIETFSEKYEVLDIEKTLLRLGNKQVFYEDLLKRYKSNYSNLVKQLSDFIINKQYDETKRYIHTLKSVTGNIGAIKLNNFITQFELEYESYDDEVITENLKILYYLNEEVLKSIPKVILKDDFEDHVSRDSFDVYSELEKLFLVLGKGRTKEIKEKMNCLVANTSDSVFMLQISEINKLIESYRFKEAKVMVEELMSAAQQGGNND